MNCKVTKKNPRTLDNLGNWWSLTLLAMGVLIVVAFLYLDRCLAISNIIHSTGWLGVVTAIFLITLPMEINDSLSSTMNKSNRV